MKTSTGLRANAIDCAICFRLLPVENISFAVETVRASRFPTRFFYATDDRSGKRSGKRTDTTICAFECAGRAGRQTRRFLSEGPEMFSSFFFFDG